MSKDSTEANAVGVLRDYYAAINAHDYETAYAKWAGDGPPGHATLAAFAEGFRSTDSVHLSIDSIGRIEGAAGSRYLDVSVRLHAYERGNAETTYVGSYVLRRAVVPGADSASAQWHLYSAKLRTMTNR